MATVEAYGNGTVTLVNSPAGAGDPKHLPA
jgi:hypothetical protein